VNSLKAIQVYAVKARNTDEHDTPLKNLRKIYGFTESDLKRPPLYLKVIVW